MAGESVRWLVHRDTYRDSVELMRVAAELERLPRVKTAALLMATPANRELLERAGLLGGEALEARPSDLVVAVEAEDEAAAEAALALAATLLAGAVTGGGRATGRERAAPRTIAEALAEQPGANLAIISTPGPYATAEALKALKRGLHAFIFSDNVALEEEVELKRLARRRGLLVMGPDCGTAILDGVPIGFANAVRRGRIGLVGASGTGLQQVSCLVDRLGEGLSQVIGVGSHDLGEAVGGLMMQAGIELLAADPETAVIGLVSKPPATAVARRVLEAAAASGKPVVVNFLGGDPEAIRAAGGVPAATLEDAARLCVALAGGDGGTERRRDGETEGRRDGKTEEWLAGAARAEVGKLAAGQRVVRGLYSGGTLCQEAGLILAAAVPGAEAAGHTTIDLGGDEYTVGRPHPMIDFRLRNEYILAAAEESSTAVILVDVVLGYGSHPDPAGELVPTIERARECAAMDGRHVVFVGSICGTASDPQGFAGQEARLAEAGVLLASSNAQAARLAALIASEAASPGVRVEACHGT